MDLIYMDGSRRDVGVMHTYEMDMAFGYDENDFQLKVPTKNHCCSFGWGLYIDGTEYGGIIDSIESNTSTVEVTYTGRTWHGILGSKIILPLQSGEASTDDVTLKTEDAEGASLVDRYLILTGDAHACIRFLLGRLGLSDLFETPAIAAGVSISGYQFHRYTDAYTGIRKMLESAGLKMRLVYTGGRVIISAVERYDYSWDEEFDSTQLNMCVKKNQGTVNHLICLGYGELEERLVVHLYADSYGTISTTQTQFGLDEYTAVYDFSSVESEEELVEGGKARLKELWSQDSVSIDFDEVQTMYDVGDIVGAVEIVTGITITATITKKIVTIKNGKITIDLQTGDSAGIQSADGITYLFRVEENGHLICKYKGAAPDFHIDADGHLIMTYSESEAPALHINANGHLIKTTETE